MIGFSLLIEFVFESDGKNMPDLFTHKRLALRLRDSHSSQPCSQSKMKSCCPGCEAKKQSVQPGWKVILVNDQDANRDQCSGQTPFPISHMGPSKIY